MFGRTVRHQSHRGRRPGRLLVLVPAVALLLAACGDDTTTGETGSSGEPKSGGTLTVALSGDPGSVYPRAVTPIVREVSRPVVDSLVALDPETRKAVPWLAESFEANDDATEYTFHLREGVTFSDGTPLTAEVVKRNFDDILATKAELTGSASVTTLTTSKYEGTEAVDERTVVQRFGKPFLGWPTALAGSGFGIVAPATLDLPVKDRFDKVIGSGPFVLESYQKNSQVVLTKRAGYEWGPQYRERNGEAYLDRLVFKVVPEASVRTGALRTGQVQVAVALNPSDIDGVEEAGFEIFSQSQPRLSEALVVTGADRAPLSDVKVRQAIARAVDTTEIRDSVLHPSFTNATSVLTSTVPGWSDTSGVLKRDPAAAERLLDEAGWTRQGDGIRQKDGKPLRIVFGWLDRGNAWDQGLVELVKAQLAKVGVDLQLRLDTAAAAVEALQAGDQYDAFLSGVAGSLDAEADVSAFATSPPNFYNIQDKEIDTLLGQLTAASDPAKHSELLVTIQERIAEQGIVVPLVEETAVVAVGKNVHGFRLDADARLLGLADVWLS
ncbi:ABC transporter substrate-binding protein [Parafrankia colletiae]|uniref:ABC transporter substrate-binding protein n=1 Tax=Parafrankia colletiae TaxID=573497 RepID=A0A1S1QFX0_9ACTN|nr:ABC transporter substrate-binding protein [Parafrankia colletiae]MCK9901929.1 ABC transporter substrate-binding protein [Frankia sp. Cpl3]OHV32880.1 ABC transporter substrate-binding protein [Parafrankia colletiae]